MSKSSSLVHKLYKVELAELTAVANLEKHTLSGLTVRRCKISFSWNKTICRGKVGISLCIPYNRGTKKTLQVSSFCWLPFINRNDLIPE